MARIVTTSAASLGLCALVLTGSAPAATGPFSSFIGSWSGNGQVRLQDERSEQIKCKAYYTERKPGMGLALRCASSGSKIDLRAQLVSDGHKVSGTWEERQFNAAGSFTGTHVDNKLTLTMEGGGLKAGVTITTSASASGPAQSFVINTDAGTVRGAQISLLRDGE